MMAFGTGTATPGVAAIAMLLVALAACAPESEQPQDQAQLGAALFDTNCSACHGADGRGPSMAEIRALGPDELRAAIRNHPTAGQIPQRLPAAEVQRIIEYLEE